MKRCPYCGAKYPNDATVCVTDGTELEDLDAPKPSPPPPTPEAEDLKIETGPMNDGGEAPEGFVCLGSFEPFDADRMLQQFTAANLRFQIDRGDRRIMLRGAYRWTGVIEIFVHKEDYDPAFKIMSADWKV